jgi:ubiquinone/menaquinone biosynthesis C-methylase UbiE
MLFRKRQPEPYPIAYHPELVPPLDLMRQEGIDVLEEWFRWAEEWSMLLRIYGHITPSSSVLEIGCGLGRIAFPLRFILSADGSYEGFDICQNKIVFLERTFHRAYPHFRFV